MEIKIEVDKLEHLKEKSFYNHNYYRCGNQGVELYQVCDEQHNTYDYYLIKGVSKVFLGSASHDENYIEFLHMYT